MRPLLYCLLSAGLASGTTLTLTGSEAPPAAAAARSADAILRSFVVDFGGDPAAEEPRIFGVEVSGEGGGTWTVLVGGVRRDDGSWAVDLVEGAPLDPTFVYTVDVGTLAAIDDGRLNAITAQGKAFPDDPSPMDVTWMPGSEELDVNPFSFHFWTRGFPERVPFHRDLGRVVHGVNNVGFYYQPGLRTIFSSIGQRQRVNNGPGQPIVVPFPVMAIAIRGRAKGLVDGQPVEMTAGEMLWIPPLTPYEWWNEEDEPAEAILIMFGEGA